MHPGGAPSAQKLSRACLLGTKYLATVGTGNCLIAARLFWFSNNSLFYTASSETIFSIKVAPCRTTVFQNTFAHLIEYALRYAPGPLGLSERCGGILPCGYARIRTGRGF